MGVKYSGSVAGKDAVVGAITAAEVTALAALTGSNTSTADASIDATEMAAFTAATVAAQLVYDATLAAGLDPTTAAANLAFAAAAEEAAAAGKAAVAAIASDTLITSLMHLLINASTESDSGVTFGVMVKVQQDDGNTNAFNAARFYAKSGGLELAVGNIYGAIDSTPGLYAGTVGLTGLGFANVVSNFADMSHSSTGAGSAGTKEAAEVIYSMGDYGFHVSTDGTDTEYGASATMSGWTVAVTGSDTDVATNAEWVATVGGKIGGVALGLATGEAVNGNSSSTVSAKFDVAAATSVTVFYNDDEANTVDDKSYGIGFSHGLGGGTSLNGGIVSVNDRTSADFGVKFNF